MAEPAHIAVLYLLRRGNRPLLFRAFLNSVNQHSTGVDYQPIVIQKGFANGDVHPLAASWITEHGRRAEVISISDEGFDLTAYRTVASRITSSYCLFFNSYTRILGHRWLETYVNALSRYGDNAVIGATGSWSSIEPETPFPSPHLRTTAIFLLRELYLSFDNSFATKESCVKFESGATGLSQSVLRSGGHIAMVGRSGQVAEPETWPDSRIYYCSDQEDLLVADNRSHEYQIAKPRSRLRRSTAAWGQSRAVATGRSWLSRRYLDWQWHRGQPVP